MVPDGSGGISSAAPEPLLAGQLVGQKYRLSHMLGTGGMGVVWAAQDIASGASLALKFLRPGVQGADDPDAIRRFLREARAAALVRHPHVVQIREVLELEDGQPVMVMELLTGESLRRRLLRGPRLSLSEAAAVLLPVASAVGTAHQHGVVHRDLKPDNIFLSSDDSGGVTVKVLDFGIAKVTRADSAETTQNGGGLTGTGEVLGTPNYMSPEQVFGERDIDQRSDVWALGVIIYECLAGLVPTKAENVGQVFKLIVAGGMKPIESVLPDAPADVVSLVNRMLARRREQRPFDLNEIVTVLRPYSDVPVPPFGPPRIRVSPDSAETARPPVPNADETVRRMGEADIIPPPHADTPRRAERRRRLGRLTTIGLGTLAVSALIGESLLLWRTNQRKTAQDQAAAVAAAQTQGSSPDARGPDGSSAGR